MSDENISEEDLGFNDKAKFPVLKNDPKDFEPILLKANEIFPNNKVDIISREQNPERFSKEIDDAYGLLVPSVKTYTHCLYRRMVTLDTFKLGKVFKKLLEER